ncbi:MAG: hypothetical protein EP335_17470 [Alphaproteobacteria bacterium]|nr:MAG: hypothetical protein EP335_17470 [Alphaproteobacteria bacterium]
MPVFAKDPASRVDYSFDWSAWLSAGESIESALWTIEPEAALNLEDTLSAGAVEGVFVSGGTAGERCRLSCRISTDAGRTAERSLAIRVMEV